MSSTSETNLDEVSKAEIDILIKRIGTGNSVLFTGAGFSKNTINISDKEPPMASGLSQMLADIAGVTDDRDDLYYTSDLCLSRGLTREIINTLRDNFVIKKVSDAHKIVANFNYRRIYTTNYDNAFELASREVGYDRLAVCLDDRPSQYIHKDICVHLNGYIEKCNESDLQSKIRLTDASYLSPDYFINSDWRKTFLHDLDCSSAIIFVGYSLYDVQVRSILHNSQHLIDKTYFITWDGASDKEVYSLSKYGRVLKIGVGGFADILNSVQSNNPSTSVELFPKSFDKYDLCKTPPVVTEEDSRNLLLFGYYKKEMIDSVISNDFMEPFIFKRSSIEIIKQQLVSGNNILIHSDLGNGKSMLVDVLAKSLAREGYNCWNLASEDFNPTQDLDYFTADNKERHYLFIDNAHRLTDFLDVFLAIKPENVNLVLCDRTPNIAFIDEKFKRSELDIHDFSVDLLEENERSHLIRMIDDSNLWREFSAESHAKKDELIREIYSNQLSGVLVGLLKSPDISERIEALVNDLKSNSNFRTTLFALCLCDAFGVEKNNSIIAEVADNESIYKSEFRNNTSFKLMYKSEHGLIKANSSVLSLFIINSFFSDAYIVEFCLGLAERLNSRKDLERDLKDVFSKLLRFNQIEKLIPQKQKAIDGYYMELKRRCTWLLNHPHYWVQYAMCKLSFNNLEDAQVSLDTAYLHAEKKYDYHTQNIDTQQARLYLLQSLAHKRNAQESYSYFEKAHSLLMSIDEDGFMFRQVLKYEDIYQQVYPNFNRGNKVNFEHACNELYTKALRSKERFTGEIEYIRRNEAVRKGADVLEKIILSIKKGREIH